MTMGVLRVFGGWEITESRLNLVCSVKHVNVALVLNCPGQQVWYVTSELRPLVSLRGRVSLYT